MVPHLICFILLLTGPFWVIYVAFSYHIINCGILVIVSIRLLTLREKLKQLQPLLVSHAMLVSCYSILLAAYIIADLVCRKKEMLKHFKCVQYVQAY